jgi:hypothetical protein
MYIISALGLRGLFSSRIPMEHRTYPTVETTALESQKIRFCVHEIPLHKKRELCRLVE